MKMEQIAQLSILLAVVMFGYTTGHRHGSMTGFEKGLKKAREIYKKANEKN